MATKPRTWTGARTPSAIKRVRSTARRAEINAPRRTKARTLVRKAIGVAAGTQPGDPQETLIEALSALDRAAKAGAIHPNAAARRKSRLTRKVNAALGGAHVTTGAKAARTAGAAAQKAAKARIAASKAAKAKGAQTAAGKARAALARTSRAEAQAAPGAATEPVEAAASGPAAAKRPAPRRAAATKAGGTKAGGTKATAAKTATKAPAKAGPGKGSAKSAAAKDGAAKSPTSRAPKKRTTGT